MIVTVIIAIVSALVLPGMGQAMRERRTQHTATTILDIVRETRSRAIYRGTTQTLVIQTSGTSLQLNSWEGSNSSCRLSTFGGGSMSDAQRVYALDLNTPEFTRHGINARIAVPASTSFLQICFTPLGVAYFSESLITDGRATGAVWSNASASDGPGSPAAMGVGGAFAIDVFQISGGVTRRIVIPLAGTPRMRT
jgi:type II secretory pathway pseudopilin PulG